MALRPEEVLRIKFQLGVSVTLIGAEPYITYLAVFDRAIQPYIIDPSTTSTTPVVAGATQSIALAAVPLVAGTTNPAIVVGSFATVDVGPAQEVVQVQILTGTTAWATFANAHGANGAYPVVMAGGEQVVREILARIALIESLLGSVAPVSAGVQEADEAKLYPSSTTGSRRGSRDTHESLIQQREAARNDLGEAVGFPNLRNLKRAAGGRVELY
jgi:hypothetical protein